MFTLPRNESPKQSGQNEGGFAKISIYVLQSDEAPKAKWYYSDGFDAYQWLWYHLGRYQVSEGKTDTYSVEGDNAELRHYLARLARQSRCFSRCPYALECALRLFVYCFNSRELYKQRYPNYPAHVMDFVSPLL